MSATAAFWLGALLGPLLWVGVFALALAALALPKLWRGRTPTFTPVPTVVRLAQDFAASTRDAKRAQAAADRAAVEEFLHTL